MHHLKLALLALMALLAFDFAVFMLWAITNQTPPTAIYVGAITANIIKLII